MSPENFQFRDVEQPLGGLVEIYRDGWWVVDKATGHGAILVTGSHRKSEHAQCNRNKLVADMLIGKINYGRPVEVRQIPIAYVRRNYWEFE